MKAIQITENGGPDVLKLVDVEIGRPGAGEVRLRHTAIGLNFIDIYYRTGLYPPPGGFPLVPGGEGAGVVVEVGEGVDWLAAGDRVAYTIGSGSYCEERLISADRLVEIPDAITDEQAAASMLKGLTVEYLLRRTFKVKPGDTVLCHAAAGGIGLMLGQWAKHLGATVLGTAGSPEKIELAKANGYDHVANSRTDDIAAFVRDATGGRRCDVVYDSVGKDTFAASLDCIRPLGMLVSFGQASGPIPPFAIGTLAQKGSLFLTRPTLFTYIAERADLEAAAEALFEVIGSGAVKVQINQKYALSDVARAHADLESRNTTGTTVLIP